MAASALGRAVAAAARNAFDAGGLRVHAADAAVRRAALPTERRRQSGPCGPAAAKAVGFDRPILHGLCVFGVATRAVLKTCCGDEPARLKSLGLRFSAPFYPGETLRVGLWRRGSTVHFNAYSAERDIAVLTHGVATVED